MTKEATTAPHPPSFDVALGQSKLVLQTTPTPADLNVFGVVFGGWLMGQADIAGGIVAFKIASGKPVFTVAADRIHFLRPVYAGSLLSFYATPIKIGTTSITIQIMAYAWESSNSDLEANHVLEASFTYVATDTEGEPTPIL